MSQVKLEYAQALFMLAMENDSVKSFENALDDVAKAFSQEPKYLQLLSSPGIVLSERLSAIEKAFGGTCPREIVSFLKLLCERRHIEELGDCICEFKRLVNELGKVSNAKVISAVELTDKEKEALKQKLEKMSGHTVMLDLTVDKSILGGIIVEIDGKVMDNSLKKHLKDVKDVISQ